MSEIMKLKDKEHIELGVHGPTQNKTRWRRTKECINHVDHERLRRRNDHGYDTNCYAARNENSNKKSTTHGNESMT